MRIFHNEINCIFISFALCALYTRFDLRCDFVISSSLFVVQFIQGMADYFLDKKTYFRTLYSLLYLSYNVSFKTSLPLLS